MKFMIRAVLIASGEQSSHANSKATREGSHPAANLNSRLTGIAALNDDDEKARRAPQPSNTPEFAEEFALVLSAK